MSKDWRLWQLDTKWSGRRNFASLLFLARSFFPAYAAGDFAERFRSNGCILRRRIRWQGGIRWRWRIHQRLRRFFLARFDRCAIFGSEDFGPLQIVVGVNVRRLFLGLRGLASLFLARRFGGLLRVRACSREKQRCADDYTCACKVHA
jgi:hypothetical protein